MLGIDEMERLKGLPLKMLAYEQLLRTRPELASRVALVQITVKARNFTPAADDGRDVGSALIIRSVDCRAGRGPADGNHADDGSKWRFEVVGSKGRILIDKDARLLIGDEVQVIKEPQAKWKGIPAGVRELVQTLHNGGTHTRAPLASAINVVEVLFGFLASHARGNARVDLPLSRKKNALGENA